MRCAWLPALLVMSSVVRRGRAPGGGEGRGGGDAQAPCSAIPYMVTKTQNTSDWWRGRRGRGLAGRGAPITGLIYILRGPRPPTFHEVCPS